MFYITKIDDYLKIFADDEVKDFIVINFSKYFKSMKEKLYSKQNLRKVDEWLYKFLTTPGEVEKYVEVMQSNSSDNCMCTYKTEILNLFDPELQPINTKPLIKNKSKKLLIELENFKV